MEGIMRNATPLRRPRKRPPKRHNHVGGQPAATGAYSIWKSVGYRFHGVSTNKPYVHVCAVIMIRSVVWINVTLLEARSYGAACLPNVNLK